MKRMTIMLLLSMQTATVLWAQEKVFPKLTGPYLGQKPPGMTPEVFAQGIISKAGFHLHSSLAFSPDGNEIYFTRIVFEPLTQGTIYCLKREGNRLTEPRIASFSGIFNDDSPTFAPDGQRLYFPSTRPLDPQDQANDLDIWYVERNGADWSAPISNGRRFLDGWEEYGGLVQFAPGGGHPSRKFIARRKVCVFSETI